MQGDDDRTFKTREEAEADALRSMLAQAAQGDDEPSTLTTCVCGRQDLADMSFDERGAIMDACSTCERITVEPGGRA